MTTISKAIKWREPAIPTTDDKGGYVLIARRSGLKPPHVYGRYSAAALEKAQQEIRRDDPDVVGFTVEPAIEFHERNTARFRTRPWWECYHDDYCMPVNVLEWPLDVLDKKEESKPTTPQACGSDPLPTNERNI